MFTEHCSAIKIMRDIVFKIGATRRFPLHQNVIVNHQNIFQLINSYLFIWPNSRLYGTQETKLSPTTLNIYKKLAEITWLMQYLNIINFFVFLSKWKCIIIISSANGVMCLERKRRRKNRRFLNENNNIYNNDTHWIDPKLPRIVIWHIENILSYNFCRIISHSFFYI